MPAGRSFSPAHVSPKSRDRLPHDSGPLSAVGASRSSQPARRGAAAPWFGNVAL